MEKTLIDGYLWRDPRGYIHFCDQEYMPKKINSGKDKKKGKYKRRDKFDRKRCWDTD